MSKKQTVTLKQLPSTGYRAHIVKPSKKLNALRKLLPGKPHKLQRISLGSLPPEGYEYVRTIQEITDSKGKKHTEEVGFTRRKVQNF